MLSARPISMLVCRCELLLLRKALARISHQGHGLRTAQGARLLPTQAVMVRANGAFRVRKSKTAPGARGPFGAALNGYCLAGSTMIRPRPRLSK